jgi:hypothetical protein
MAPEIRSLRTAIGTEKSTHDMEPVRRRIEFLRLAAGNDHGSAHIYAVVAFAGVRLEGE